MIRNWRADIICKGACIVGQKGCGDFGGSRGVVFQFPVCLKMWLINLNGHLLEFMGLILTRTEGCYGRSYPVCAIGGMYLGLWEEILILCDFSLNAQALSFLLKLCISFHILSLNTV